MSDEDENIVGTWDGLADAVDVLEKSGLFYVLHVAMHGSTFTRTRINLNDAQGLDWIRKQGDLNLDMLREDILEDEG